MPDCKMESATFARNFLYQETNLFTSSIIILVIKNNITHLYLVCMVFICMVFMCVAAI